MTEPDLSSESPKPTDETNKIVEHLMTIEMVCEKFQTNINSETPYASPGLTTDEVNRRLEQNGRNALSPPKKKSPFLKYLDKVSGLFNVLLIVAGLLAILLYFLDSSEPVNIYLGAILIFVALMNAFIEFFQEYKTSAILESFKNLVAQTALTIRDGSLQEVDAAEIVVGDLISLKMGDKAPADLRLISCNEMKVDCSSITGESEPQERNLAKNIENPLEATCLVLSGSQIVSGEGIGIVIRVGDDSMLGQIASLAVGSEQRTSQLTEETDVFVRRTALVAIVVAVVFFLFGLGMNYGIGITFSFGIGTFVAFIPQGLPVTVTLLLTIAAKRLAKKQVLVKDLQAVETLGSITVLATDKTGTLTQNKMSVVCIWMNNLVYGGNLDKLDQSQLLNPSTPNATDLLNVCGLCSKSKFDPSESELPAKERKIFGDATEIGLLKFALNYYDIPEAMNKYQKAFEIPFNSTNKWHLTILKMPHETGAYTMMVKGAPERVKKMCKFIRINDEDIPWTEEHDKLFETAYEMFASKGRRVLAFAQKKLDTDLHPEGFEFSKDPLNFKNDDFVFLGLIGLMDPPKHGVRKAVAACRTAGIQVIMITGDHPLTAEAIARNVGLIQGKTAQDVVKLQHKPLELVEEDEYDAVIVHGDEIDDMTTEDWDKILSKLEIVFARTSPKHKLEIVTRLQSKGHIASGDGVNDSPALKKADLGISMNHSASDVSKEAASMILLDDNFATIVAGIQEGRLIFVNLKKSIRYTLTHIMPEVLAFLIFIIFGIPLPISSILVLFFDLGVEIGPAISYAYERPEGDLMRVPPRKALIKVAKPKSTEQAKKRRWFWQKKSKVTDLEKATNNEGATQDIVVQPLIPVEEMKSAPKTKIKLFWAKLVAKFQVKGTGEMLVDSDLIIWSYFQGGIIETIGCFASYLVVLWAEHVPFDMLYKSAMTYWQVSAPPLTLTNGTVADANAQIVINNKAQSSYFVTLMIIQWFNLFIQKHRYSYPWGWDMFKNKATYAGIALSASVAAIIIYVPGLNNVIIRTSPAPIEAYVAPVVTGILLYIYEVIRRYLRHRGYFGGIPKKNVNLVDLVRTTSTLQ